METAGFVLIDSLYRPVYANPESIRILGYPNSALNPAAIDSVLTQKIISFLPQDLESLLSAPSIQFQSGRRRYSCRAFVLEDHLHLGSADRRIGLLMERGLAGAINLSKHPRRLAGMSEDAFSFAPDPRYYFFSRGHQEVFASIRNLVRERRGIGVVLGQAGMGKTAMLEYLVETLRAESEIAWMPSSFNTRSELVRGVMGILGIDKLERDLDENLRHFEAWLLSKNQAGRLVTLICDDAQDFSFEMLENLCLFSRMQSGEGKLLQVILAGRQGLLEKLGGARLEDAGKLITLYSRLAPLDESEVRGYILYRLRMAGCNRQLFTPAALSSIAMYSRGIPLNINMICRHSMSLAATINQQTVDDRIVADSAYDLVLRAQPANFEDPFSIGTDLVRPAGLGRDRRGLRLVEKTPS